MTGLDTTAAEQEVVAAATEAVGSDRFASGAAAFAAANPQTPDLFDLGDVPEAVGVPAGYGCLYEPAGTVEATDAATAPPTATGQGS